MRYEQQQFPEVDKVPSAFTEVIAARIAELGNDNTSGATFDIQYSLDPDSPTGGWIKYGRRFRTHHVQVPEHDVIVQYAQRGLSDTCSVPYTALNIYKMSADDLVDYSVSFVERNDGCIGYKEYKRLEDSQAITDQGLLSNAQARALMKFATEPLPKNYAGTG